MWPAEGECGRPKVSVASRRRVWSAAGECGRLSMSVADICHCDSVASKGNPLSRRHEPGYDSASKSRARDGEGACDLAKQTRDMNYLREIEYVPRDRDPSSRPQDPGEHVAYFKI